MAIEFNTRFLYRDHTVEEKHKYLEANKRLLRKCKAAGVMIAVGSDAHSPKDQGGAFDTVLDVLDGLGVNEIAFPHNGRMARVALRVVKPEPPPVEKRVPARAGATRKTPSPVRMPERKAANAKPVAKSKAVAKKKPKPVAKKVVKKVAPKRMAAAKKKPAAATKKHPVKKAAPAKKPAAKKVAVKRPAPAKKQVKKGGKRR